MILKCEKNVTVKESGKPYATEPAIDYLLLRDPGAMRGKVTAETSHRNRGWQPLGPGDGDVDEAYLETLHELGHDEFGSATRYSTHRGDGN